MSAFRCTSKLLKAMKATPVEPAAPPANRLGEWTANLVRVSRIQLVIAVNEPTRMAVVIDAAPYASVPERFRQALWTALIGLEVPAEQAAEEVEAMGELAPAASNSRSVLATLNRIAGDVDAALRYGRCNSAASLTRHLAGNVVLKPAHIGFPADRVREAFGLAPLARERWEEIIGW